MKENRESFSRLELPYKSCFFSRNSSAQKKSRCTNILEQQHYKATLFQTTNIWLELYYSILESIRL